MEPLTFLLVALVGGAAGAAAGLFGVGGGVVMVPAAILLLGLGFHDAKAASLLVITASALVGVWEHRKAGNVDARLALRLALGGVVGSVAAVHLAEVLADGLLRLLFGALMVLAGVRLWFDVRPRPGAAPRRGRLAVPLGVGAGLLAGLFGVGGGILMVPGMVLLGVPVHTAVGTSLLALLPNAAVGTVEHVRLGYGPSLLAAGLPLVVGAVPGIALGARLANRTSAPRLRRAFGVFLAVLGVFLAVTSGVCWPTCGQTLK